MLYLVRYRLLHLVFFGSFVLLSPPLQADTTKGADGTRSKPRCEVARLINRTGVGFFGSAKPHRLSAAEETLLRRDVGGLEHASAAAAKTLDGLRGWVCSVALERGPRMSNDTEHAVHIESPRVHTEYPGARSDHPSVLLELTHEIAAGRATSQLVDASLSLKPAALGDRVRGLVREEVGGLDDHRVQSSGASLQRIVSWIPGFGEVNPTNSDFTLLQLLRSSEHLPLEFALMTAATTRSPTDSDDRAGWLTHFYSTAIPILSADAAARRAELNAASNAKPRWLGSALTRPNGGEPHTKIVVPAEG